MLNAIYRELPETQPIFHQADAIARRELGQVLLPLVQASTRADHDRLLEQNPDIPQIGIFLGAALIAQLLIERGAKPELLVGHSMGEFAALATAGVYPLETGVETSLYWGSGNVQRRYRACLLCRTSFVSPS